MRSRLSILLFFLFQAEKSAEKEKKVDPVVLVKPPTIKIEVVHAGKTDADKMDLSKPDSRNEDSADMYKKYADKLEKTGE